MSIRRLLNILIKSIYKEERKKVSFKIETFLLNINILSFINGFKNVI